MIKKIYAILFTISLIASLPIFGMEKDTFPCDSCNEPQKLLNVLNRTNWPTYCQHILCNTCDETIKNTDLEDPTDAPYYEELDEFSYECKYCYYFKCKKNIKCEQNQKKSAFDDMIGQKASWIKANCPNRILADVIAETMERDKPAETPTLLSTNDNKTKQSIHHCDSCNENINDINPVKTEHMLNKVEGTCSYFLCNTCQEYTEIFKECTDENIQNTYDNCKTCFYFNTLGLDLKWQPITYPCENCHQEKTKLIYRDKRKTGGVECNHVFCQECQNIMKSWQEPTDDKVWWNCKYCSYFYHQKAKQCWQITEHEGFKSFKSPIHATTIQKMYPDKVVLNITEKTQFPRHPRDHQKVNQPNQDGQNPAQQNPNEPTQLTNRFVINNKIQWLGIAGIAGFVCYGAYKAYTWWKSEEKKEHDDNNKQDDWKKEEAINTAS